MVSLPTESPESKNYLSDDAEQKLLASSTCFHCQLPIPADSNLSASIENVEQPMCCYGCKAVAEAIVAAGHAHFYRVRTEASPTGNQMIPDFLRESQVYDNESVQRDFVRQLSDHEREASLILQGITCAACVWLNEQHIGSLDGVLEVQVNYASRRAWVRWDESKIKLSEILQAIRAIGYQAQPYNPDQQQQLHQQERRAQIRRLAVAGLFGMQVMMVSISLYAGAWSGMEQNFETLFRWLSLALSLPVLLYSATSFFRTAWYDLQNRRVGMDVPVSFAISIAFVASVMATVRGQGEIYFDSLVMFVFLLLLSRYFEWMARQRSAESVERLAHALPLMANRLQNIDGDEELVAAALLDIGDIVLIKPGETIPADGEVLAGESTVDESLLNGESKPVRKQIGDQLIGGSINLNNAMKIRVQAVGSDTVLSGIHRMIERAQADKPPLAALADRIASRFILAVLIATTAVALYWWFADVERWFEITLAVLIVTCPCALSLATPAAISAGLSRMQSLGLLVKRAQAIDALDRVSHVVFDKTGTLTKAKPALYNSKFADAVVDYDRCLTIAASLEQYSEHPLAQAFIQAAGNLPRLAAERVTNQPGGGLSATIEGQEYAVGSIDFIEGFCKLSVPEQWQSEVGTDAATLVALASKDQILCLFALQDELRDDAESMIQRLKSLGKKTILMTGDGEAAAQQVSTMVGIETYQARLSPDQKMEEVRALQATGATVLMVGDGINDAPVLANADVSIAMGSASSLAKTSADVVMLSNRLDSIIDALSMSRKIERIIRQNFIWALTYNFCAIPAAAAGFVAPWMAAIGMSLSSLIVVGNALRLRTIRLNR